MDIDAALLALLFAHQGEFARTLMLEPAGEVLHVVVHAKVTGEDRRRSLGLLDATTRRSLLVERALEGVRLFAGTTSVSVENVEVKTELEGRLEVMVHGTARIGAGVRAGQTAGDVSVETAVNADPIDLVVLPGNRPVVRASRGAKSGGLRTRMGPGDRVRWQMLVDWPRPH